MPILTPEQRAEIVEKMENRRKRSEKGGWGIHQIDHFMTLGIDKHLNVRAGDLHIPAF